MHLPLKIAKHIDDLEKGGRAVQDVHSTVGGHISQLPDEILECILNKLKLRDAVRAGLVSWRWNYLVLSRARLVFDLPNMFETENSDLKGASGKKCLCSEYKNPFVQAVNQFIASYRGRRVDKFIVHFCLKKESARAVSNWIRFALDLGVKVLNVQLYCEHLCKARVALCGNVFKFHPCEIPIKRLLSSNRDAGEAFNLRPFRQLVVLRFHHICLKSQYMKHLLSSLVNLKQLQMRQCELPPYLRLNSLTSLEGVSVWYCTGLKKINVASLKLKSLQVFCGGNVSLVSTGVPNLKDLCYAVHGNGMWRFFLKLPERFPHLRSLRVDSSSNWLERMPESRTTFSRLRTLILALDSRVGDIMFKMVQLVKLCPLLTHLTTWLSTREDKEPEKLESVEYHHKCLKWITIYGFVGTKYQIESCKFLLKLAPRAKELALMPVAHVLSEEERERVVNTLKAFSNDAKVLFV